MEDVAVGERGALLKSSRFHWMVFTMRCIVLQLPSCATSRRSFGVAYLSHPSFPLRLTEKKPFTTTMNAPLTPNVMSNSSRDISQSGRRATAELRLEQMLAKAELLANEMREAAHSSSASQPKATRRRHSANPQRDSSSRSLPQIIDLSPPDDTARSECSSLGLSLASTMMIPKSSSTPSPAENAVFVESGDAVLVPDNMCGVIREGSIYDDDCGDEKKSCDGSTAKEASADHVSVARSIKNENVPNSRMLSPMDIPTQTFMSTPPSVKQTFGLTAEPSTNLSKAILQEVPSSSHTRKSRSSWEPRSTIVSEQDEDYVPIKDYSVPTHREVANVKWEKVDTATVGDDDYVPLKDYSQSTKKKPSRRHAAIAEDDGAGLSYTARRALWLQRKRKKRRQRRLALVMLVILSVLGYFAYLRYTDWAMESVSKEVEYATVVDVEPEENDATVAGDPDVFIDDALNGSDIVQGGFEERNETDVIVPLENETVPLVISLEEHDCAVVHHHFGWNLLVHFELMDDRTERRRWVEDLMDRMWQ
jgi:hypothetical protein